MRNLIALYLRDTEQQLVKLQTAIQNNSVIEVMQLAHTCAGSSASCGVTALVPPLKQLEQLGRAGQLKDAPRLLMEAVTTFHRARVFLETLS